MCFSKTSVDAVAIRRKKFEFKNDNSMQYGLCLLLEDMADADEGSRIIEYHT